MSHHPPPDPAGDGQAPVVSGPPASPPPYGQPQPPGHGYAAPPMYPQVVVAQAPPTSGWAVASLIFGIIGMLGGFCLLGAPCIAAVICGHAGLIETKNGTRGGHGLAIAGLILGYLFVAPAIAVIVMGGVGSMLPASSTTP